MRTLRLLIATLVLAGACNNAAKPPPAPEPERAVSRIRAAAIAKAGTLRREELPGWSAARPKPDKASSAPSGFWACMGRPERTYAAGDAVDFAKGKVTLSSSVLVAPTLTQAGADYLDFRNPAHLYCLEQDIRAELKLPAGVTMSPLRTKAARVVIRGTPTYGHTASTTVQGPGGSMTLNLISVGAQVGHAEVNLMAIAAGPVPDAATMTRLLSRAVTRVKAVRA